MYGYAPLNTPKSIKIFIILIKPMDQVQDEEACKLFEKVRQGLPADELKEEEEILIFDVVKKMIDNMWIEVNP